MKERFSACMVLIMLGFCVLATSQEKPSEKIYRVCSKEIVADCVKEPPKLVIAEEPSYTDEARKANVQGKVALQVVIGADGKVKEAKILKGLGYGLDESAASTVRRWVFKPVTNDKGEAVPVQVKLELVFKL